MTLQNRFHKALLLSDCIPTGSHLLVAVSGGADSVALLRLLHGLPETLNLSLEAAHLDHGLRAVSRDDAAFVAQLCHQLGVPVTVARQDVAEIALRRKGNLEEVARDVRREFLEATAKERNCDLIVLGHHAGDQAETFLMRLMRGAGTAGLAGMRQVDGRVIRPLLSFHHEELVTYLEEGGFAWREDESNINHAFTRNRIRHQLQPLLESFNPNITSQIAGLCEQLRLDEDFWSELANRTLTELGTRVDGGYSIQRGALAKLAPSLASRVIRAALREIRGDLRSITATHIGDVLQLVCAGPPQGELHLPGSWAACRYEQLLLYREPPELVAGLELVLDGPGTYQLLDGRRLQLSVSDHASGGNHAAVEFDASTLQFPLTLRHCLPGDRFRPSGMDGTKKIQDFFVDLKLAMEDRKKTLLLLEKETILWIVGLRRCEGWRPVAGKPVLRVQIMQKES
ncbi:MAG: tRNA lysidine(34) synthetase TilS [Deltaproteobacteria bacterium]|jgi:tRNA(Ile)-lysidine synthase|nr:tRNA lysidine(34) synthetase TilS [Deltaproteobacteria bacterium]MBW2511666.1 tRNA lysidine(34) synthetase TilS [Deltaproteobacteria bacterium]